MASGNQLPNSKTFHFNYFDIARKSGGNVFDLLGMCGNQQLLYFPTHPDGNATQTEN
jgi:hypothetical protein